MNVVDADEALRRLMEGNRRFVENVRSVQAMVCDRAELSRGQRPFAIVLCCSDSRSPAETIFDQGLGCLFVIRVAGNIVAPSQIASVEFAVERFHTRLVVVMGHSHCGAISATLDAIQAGRGVGNLASIVDRIRPAVLPLLQTELAEDRESLERAAVRANVEASVRQLRYGSRLLEEQLISGGLRIVGAEYDLVTGRVDFFETERELNGCATPRKPGPGR